MSDDKIVREIVNFTDRPKSGFDPSIFGNVVYRNWSHDADWKKAKERYWYTKFYEETRTGQLMVLRPDKPELHCYAKGRDNIQSLLSQVRILLWLLIVLIGLLLLRR